MGLDLIYTKDDMFVSKQHEDWRVWQDRFNDYKACLSFKDLDELTDFLIIEYKLNQVACNPLGEKLQNSNSDLFILELPKNKNDSIEITPLLV